MKIKSRLTFLLSALVALLLLNCVNYAQSGGGSSLNWSFPSNWVQGFYNITMVGLNNGQIEQTTDFPLTSNLALNNTATLSAVYSAPPVVVSGHTYGFSVNYVVNGTATAGLQIAMNGTANGALGWFGQSLSSNTTAESVSFAGYETALATGNLGSTFVTTGANSFTAAGTFTANATGTFGPWAAQQAANATITNITTGSDFKIWLEN